MVSASDSAPEVPGFADHLGERFIVPQPSGSLLELLYFQSDLATAPFFEPAVKDRLARLANFRHSSYTRVRRYQRGEDRGGVALVSTHVPGRRLAELLQISARAGLRPKAPAVLALSRQLMTAVALMHDYGPDIFHGAITPERLILPGEGRIVLCEYVLGTVFEQAVPSWGVPAVWRDWRVPMLADTALGRYGRRVDLLQIGLVVLAFLLGRAVSAAEYPEGLARLLDEGCEAAGEGGWPAPEARAWLSSMLWPERPDAFRTLVESQKAFGAALAGARWGEVTPAALQGFVDQCEGAAWSQPGEITRPPAPTPTTLMSAAAMLDAVSEGQPPSPGTLLPAIEPEGPAEGAVADGASPDTDWFAPGQHYLDYQHADSCEAVPAFPVEAPLEPTPADLGLDGPVAAAPEPVGEVPPPEPALESQRELATEPPPERTFEPHTELAFEPPPEPAPPVTDPAETVQVTPRGQAPDLPGPEPPAPWRAPEPASQDPGAAAGSRAARPRRVASKGGPARSPSLSGRRPKWQIAAIAACAVLLVGLGAVVAPIAWTRVMGGGAVKGSLAVESEPAGAEVVLDGKAAGRTPLVSEIAAGQHHVEVRIGGSTRAAWVTVPEGERLVHRVSMPEAALRGVLHIVTDPPGGTVSVDGTARGQSPVRVADLAPGAHRVVASGPFGPVEEQEVTVAGGAETSVTVPTVGWLRIRSPYPLKVSEQGRSFGETSGQALMVPAGRHHFDLSNAALALKVRQFVDVPPGKVVTIPFEAPMGMMNLSSDEPAEVWLDGRLIGHTPLTTLPASLGSHEVVFRHAQLGDVSYTVNVTLAAPVRLTVTFNKKKHP